MKYESELIKEIVDTKGHEKSPLHYESECIESWIDEVKGAYPKLTDYRGEWLNYMVENPIGEFPYITLSDVTDATVDNVVPYAYKSAILKGQTLVNLYKADTTKTISDDSFYFVNAIPSSMYKPNTYTVINTTNKKITIAIRRISSNAYIRNVEIDALTKTTLTLSNDEWIRFFIASTSNGWVIDDANDESMLKKMVVIDGDYTNEDIPYFEGMQSVKMPVLKTVGKNLYNKSPFNGYIDSSSGKFVSGSTTRKISDYIEVEPNKKYKVSGCTMTTMWGYDEDKNPISAINFYNDITTTSDMHFIAFTINSEVEHSNIQLEEGTVTTPYEPHKSNILTTTNCLNLFTKDNTVADGNLDVYGDFVEAKKNDKFSFNEKHGDDSWTSLSIYDVNKEIIYYKYGDSHAIPKTIVLPDDD